MHSETQEIKSNDQQRAPLVWEDVKRFRPASDNEQNESGVCVNVRRARLQGRHDNYIYSIQIGMSNVYNDRIAPFIPVKFERESLNISSTEPMFERDLPHAIGSALVEAVRWIHEQQRDALKLKQESIYSRDLERAHKPQGGQRTMRAGKTERERDKRKGKK